MSPPLVSCLMVTRDRPHLAARALRCLAAQTYRPLELVVVDDGRADYEPVLAPCRDRFPVHYLRLAPRPGRYLGGLRNLALDEARGALCAQWDDDEWYHPERLATQVAALERSGAVASVLKWTLMHVATDAMRALPFRADAGAGTPGTIVHRRTDVRYPNLPRAEDARFLERLAARGEIAVLGAEHSHLFIRCFHGANTWDERHFRRRLTRTPRAAASYLWARLRGDLRHHRQLQLTGAERAVVEQFLADSHQHGLL